DLRTRSRFCAIAVTGVAHSRRPQFQRQRDPVNGACEVQFDPRLDVPALRWAAPTGVAKERTENIAQAAPGARTTEASPRLRQQVVQVDRPAGVAHPGAAAESPGAHQGTHLVVLLALL